MSAPSLGLTARAVVDRVVDGDTIDLHITIPVRVRLLDCWAPEISGEEKESGLASKEALEGLLPQGSKVHLNVPTAEVDALAGTLTFGRVLGQVYIPGDDVSVSQKMVVAGYATEVKVSRE